MGLTTRPTKNIDLSKIDEIQDEFFSEKLPPSDTDDTNLKKGISTDKKKKTPENIESESKKKIAKIKKPAEISAASKTSQIVEKKSEQGGQKIADLLATEKVKSVRFISRPYTVPRSLTIDLNRLKSQFRTRDLHFTQNELMDQMIRESLEIITVENYRSLRETALNMIKSPEQCSRRTVTLTEETVSGMAELKADLALSNNRRYSGDEIFTTLLAVAFSTLYKTGLL